MVGNSVGICKIFDNLTQKYDSLYSKRAFVHWYVGEGLSEGFFEEARNEITYIEKDYEELTINVDDVNDNE